MADQLSDRGKRILEAVIEDYIATAEPVGSRTITRSHALALSPATVRNVMSDLEEMGFLTSPHTSAGRIPTDKAYRLYVNSILEVKHIARDNREEIQRRCRLAGKDMAEILKETSRLLSSTSSYMGVVMAPRPAVSSFITSVQPASASSARSSASIWPFSRRTRCSSFCFSSTL